MTTMTDSNGAIIYSRQVPLHGLGYGQSETKIEALRWAENLFLYALKKGRWHKVITFLLRHSNQLWHLHPSAPTTQLRQGQLEWVSLGDIKGSTNGRIHDFDDNFYPTQSHNKNRWVNVATAVRLGKQLPPVELMQIDNIYFVVDGHHRLSVAQAMGQTEVEAHVTIHQMVMPE